MPNTVQLKKNGQPVFPVTDVSLVMGLAERPLMDAVYAWDGTGTPDITKIPAGVTVEYNSTTYTGTLAASIDYMHWDEETDANGQIAWLRNTLADARTNGLHTIIATHYLAISDLSGHLVHLDTTFNTKDLNIETVAGEHSILPDIVNDFQEDGGIFVCYLSGHTHKDITAVYENYPNQIVICQACTADFDWHRDSVFTHDTDYELQFNLYGFDSACKFIKVYRVGGHYDRNLQHRESMLLSYDVSKVNKLIASF